MKIFVYDISEYEEDNEDVRSVIESGTAVMFDEYQEKLLSKKEFLTIAGVAKLPAYDLEEFLALYDDGKFYPVEDGMTDIRFKISEPIHILLSELYDKSHNFADRIYTSENPENEIDKIIIELVPLAVSRQGGKLSQKLESIKNDIEKDEFYWFDDLDK